MLKYAVALALSASLVLACSSSTGAGAILPAAELKDDGGTSTVDPLACDVAPCHVEGEMRCNGDTVQTCIFTPGGCGSLVASTVCSATGSVCRSGACVVPSAQQTQWLSNLKETITLLERELGNAPALAVDTDALYTRVSSHLLGSPDEPRSFATALRQISLAYPNGHLLVGAEGLCGTEANPYGEHSRIGACTQPYQDHAVVSYVGSDNPLGLVPGDEIVGIGGATGAAMIRASLEQPLCHNGSASVSNSRYQAATSLFATIAVGDTVDIKHLTGAVETKTLSRRAAAPIACRDPFGRPSNFVAQASSRPDGVAVIRVPSLYKEGVPQQQVFEATRQEILRAFQSVHSAHTIIWDLRANSGGASHAGMEIVSGMRSRAPGTVIAAYDVRKPGTAQYSGHYDFAMPDAGELVYTGKVAMLIDGLSISAADYTALAAKRFGVPLVGAPASGSYGGGVPIKFVGTAPRVLLAVDPYRGLAIDGTGLEGKSVEPDFAVELSPTDLARGIDSVLEASIAHAR